MRKRIRQIARDKFEYDQPCISLPEEELSIQVLEGQTYEGSFSVASTNRIPVRGIVYTTNPRMECLTDRKSTRLNSSHPLSSRMPSSA